VVERRKTERVTVSGQEVSGRIVLAADLDIRDISSTGIRFLCCDRLTPQSRITLVIGKNESQVSVDGTVVRSSLRATDPGTCGGSPFYEVAVTFVDGGSDERAALERLVGLLRRD